MTQDVTVPEFVWDAPDNGDGTEAEVSGEATQVSVPVTAPAVTTQLDINSLTPAERAALIKQLADQGKAARDAAKAAREQLKALRGESVSRNPEQDALVFGDIVKHLHESETVVTDSVPKGFKRLTGTVEHEGVTYHVTASARVAQRRGRPSA